MLAIIPVFLAAFAGLASAAAAPNATVVDISKFSVSNIDKIEDIWGAPKPGKVARRGENSSLGKRQGAGPNTPRLLNCHGVMQIKDDESWPFNDEYFTRTRDIEFILGVSNVNARTYTWVERAGGEIRVEVLLTATLNPSNGAITLRHHTKLFEGTSTSTNDLDGQGSGGIVVVRNGQLPMAFTVHNTAEGGDWTKVTLTCTNGRVR